MKLTDFDFLLPPELIAQYPLKKRDESKMLVINKDNIIDAYFKSFPEYLNENDVVVFNNSKVIPALLYGDCHGRKHRINLHQRISQNQWRCFILKSKYLQKGDILSFADDFSSIIIEKFPEGDVLLEFISDNLDLSLIKYGQMPLPPYIKRDKEGDNHDKEDYQTIYAKTDGSVAAPTAGLHFSEDVLLEIKKKANIAFVTLHVGAGTFLPVKTDNISEHKMHSEYYEIPQETVDMINNAKQCGGKIIAVGTTSLRTLEACVNKNGRLKAASDNTDIFITPGYKFKIVDRLLTNFHLPKSTLFMLVCAFGGFDNMHSAYQHAIREKYRFFSYGDCCLMSSS